MPDLYGIAGAFHTPTGLVRAAARARQLGYRHLDAYSPMPVDGLAEALGLEASRLPWVVLAAGFAGLGVGLALCRHVGFVCLPLDVGDRPLIAWLSAVPMTITMTLLSASLAAMIGMLVQCGLPAPYHPIFNAPGFARASSDRFFLCVEATDPEFEVEAVRRFFVEAGAEEVCDVAP